MMNHNSKEQYKLLITDRDQLFLRLLRDTLVDEFDIITAGSCASLFTLASEQKPDVILLDIEMMPLEGFQLCDRLKQNPATKDIPVVFITARSTWSDEVRGLEVGGIDYIRKPVNPPVLRARLHNHAELKQIRDRLEYLAREDPLTAIPNRRQFEEVLEVEWRRCRRENQTIAIIMMDIDNFKQFNDNYGHSAGDDCLRKVAKALRAAVKRPADLMARYGGEEFVCILPNTDLSGATALARTMCKNVTDLQILHKCSSAAKYVTLSSGVAVATPKDDISPLDLIRHADEMLYAVKVTGRNRVKGSIYSK